MLDCRIEFWNMLTHFLKYNEKITVCIWYVIAGHLKFKKSIFCGLNATCTNYGNIILWRLLFTKDWMRNRSRLFSMKVEEDHILTLLAILRFYNFRRRYWNCGTWIAYFLFDDEHLGCRSHRLQCNSFWKFLFRPVTRWSPPSVQKEDKISLCRSVFKTIWKLERLVTAKRETCQQTWTKYRLYVALNQIELVPKQIFDSVFNQLTISSISWQIDEFLIT